MTYQTRQYDIYMRNALEAYDYWASAAAYSHRLLEAYRDCTAYGPPYQLQAMAACQESARYEARRAREEREMYDHAKQMDSLLGAPSEEGDQ